MINLSLEELMVIAKPRKVENYKSQSEDEWIKILSEPESKISLSKKRIKQIGEKFNKLRDKFSKSKIKEIRRNLYEIKNKNNLSTSKKRGWKKYCWIRKKSF